MLVPRGQERCHQRLKLRLRRLLSNSKCARGQAQTENDSGTNHSVEFIAIEDRLAAPCTTALAKLKLGHSQGSNSAPQVTGKTHRRWKCFGWVAGNSEVGFGVQLETDSVWAPRAKPTLGRESSKCALRGEPVSWPGFNPQRKRSAGTWKTSSPAFC